MGILKSVFYIMLITSFISLTSATYVNMVEPFNYTIYNGKNVALGKVGPGQTFFITINSNATNPAGVLVERGWNELLITKAPSGWLFANSPLNRALVSIKVSVPGNAKNGTYNFTLKAVNTGNYSKLGNITFNASINVTTDVFKLNIYPTNITTGPSQPTPIYVSINNTGVSDNPFIISVVGLPAWENNMTVIALHHMTKVFKYPIYEDEPGVYPVSISVVSSSSPLIHKSENVEINIRASLLNDYKALGEGITVFPIIYAPAYAIMNIIGKFFN
ncbi:MAG: hypothetical protein ACP5UN_00275 [Candidatus Micrarchaeia archaeon]